MARASTTSDVFNALGDETRRRILQVLGERERTVGDLVDVLGLGQPQVSKHLKVLREVDLVRVETVGRQRLYRVHAAALNPLHHWLDRLTAAVNERYDRLDDYLASWQITPDNPSSPEE